MSSAATRSLRHGTSETVALPEAIAYGREIDLIAERTGDVVTLRPAVVIDPIEEKRKLSEMIAKLRAIGPIGEIEKREPIEFPDRPGLY